jgi:hypothetical protein
MPEELPATESIARVEKRLKSEDSKKIGKSNTPN